MPRWQNLYYSFSAAHDHQSQLDVWGADVVLNTSVLFLSLLLCCAGHDAGH
jgi:hypothetical protein